MKIIADLQSLQGISRNRGIGRYSLAFTKALIRQAKDHEIHILLNGNLIEPIESIRTTFNNLIPENHIKIFETPENISSYYYCQNTWRIKATEKIREHFLASLTPDIVYIASPFEGWIDNSPISIDQLNHNYLTVATFYDLIPFIFPESYVQDTSTAIFLAKRMQLLKQTNLLLSISDSASQEAINLLTLPTHRVINCSVGVDPEFRPYHISEQDRESLLKDYGIRRDFIFYIGGIDARKNTLGLAQAYSYLSAELKKKYQLVVIVSAPEAAVTHYLDTIKCRFNFKLNQIIFLSYIPEDKLKIFYNACSLFVFPSLHEGFGLPIIEAMACGTPTIASNTSSIPEAIGCPEALFDPKNPHSIANKIIEALTNNRFRNFLTQQGEKHVKKFTWENTAEKALSAFENLYERNKQIPKSPLTKIAYHRKKLAYVSPLPPEKTGIAYYSTKLLPELACFYEIVLITDQEKISNHSLKANFPIKKLHWFLEHALSFDIILYQLGNSSFHQPMLDLLDQYPGIVVLHDFFLSGLYYWTALNIPTKKDIFYDVLYQSHGFPGLIYQEKKDWEETNENFPCNLSVIKRALGIIIHSQHALDLAKQWYGPNIIPSFKVVAPPHFKKTISTTEREASRKRLGFSKNDFIIGAFGILHQRKLNQRLMETFIKNLSDKNEFYQLVFIGEILGEAYKNKLLNLAKGCKREKQIHFTGFVTEDMLNDYLISLDIAVQLRTHSRGETSSSLLNCLSYGIPTIANTHGSVKEISDNALIKLSDPFTDSELAAAINRLYQDTGLRQKLSAQALDYIKKNHHPTKIGAAYYHAIEDSYTNNPNAQEQCLIRNLSKKSIEWSPSEEDLLATAVAISANRSAIGFPQLLIDISAFRKDDPSLTLEPRYQTLLLTLLSSPPIGFRSEPIYYDELKNQYFYALQNTAQLLSLKDGIFQTDRPLEIDPQDILLTLGLFSKHPAPFDSLLEKYQAKKIKNYLIVTDSLISDLETISLEERNSFLLSNFKKALKISDGLICLKEENINTLIVWLNSNTIQRNKPLKIGVLTRDNKETIPHQLLGFIQENQWTTEWAQNNSTGYPSFAIEKPICRRIYIGDKEYTIQGGTRYLDYAGNPFDPSLVSIFNHFCKDTYQVLDLGAHIGLTAIALADTCKNGKVLAIEPIPDTFEILKNNIKNTNINNIVLHNFGVGNQESELVMQTARNFTAGAFVANTYQTDKKHASSFKVPIKSLDKIFGKLEIKHVDFIKMDIEGYELFALEGAKDIIKRFKPIVYLEMNHWCLNVFYRITLPEFRERLSALFPYIFAIEPNEQPSYLDFTSSADFHYIAHEHLVKLKYSNLIAGFKKDEIIQKLSAALPT